MTSLGLLFSDMTSKHKPEWDAEKFKTYLEESGLSKKSANDCISRCRRVEKILNINLVNETSSESSYISLMKKIRIYAENVADNVEKRYAITGTLRNSVRHFAGYRWTLRAKDYPKHYGL